MIDPGLGCQDERRRGVVRSGSIHGLDYVEVSESQLTLTVVLLGKAPSRIEKENIRIAGGRRIRDIQVTSLQINRQSDPTLDDSMDVGVNKRGDFSTYTLSMVNLDDQGRPTKDLMVGFDPRYDEVSFSFKAGCPSDLDCKTPPDCPPPQRTQTDINYLAKDYQSFRQLILDRLALTMPDWQETHAADLGIALVELLAYVGDYLSYYQDAVATEAYLGTARQRISVRRHARLVDYQMHEGCNARTWVTIKVDKGNGLPDPRPIALDPKNIYFITGFPGAPERRVLLESELQNIPPGRYEVFEALVADRTQDISIYQSHSEISFYTWGDCECCLARGATSATLTDHWVDLDPHPTAASGTAAAKIIAAPASYDGPQGTVRALGNLSAGDVLIFEEVIGPKTGNPADADPTHRQAVRMTKVTTAVDPLYHQEKHQDFGWPVVEIEWCSEDALTFPLCISAQAPPPDCTCKENISVAHGNVILVDNGATTTETLGTVSTQTTVEYCTECGPAEIVTVPDPFHPPPLKGTPLTFSNKPKPLPPCGCARALIAQDPRQALPQISLIGTPTAPDGPESVPSPRQSPPLLAFEDLDNPAALARKLKTPPDHATQLLADLLSQTTKRLLANWDGASVLTDVLSRAIVKDLAALLWQPKSDLLESGPDDADFVVETDNDGYAHLRFGDGDLGRMPAAGTTFQASYRVGNGPAGNVGAETISYLVFKDKKVGNLIPRNPLPAIGGTASETMTEVKLFAPSAFRNALERAITGDDYAALAQENARRLAERPALLAPTPDSLDADPVPSARGSVSRAAVEEEPGGKSLLGPDACLTPFRGLQGAKGTLRWTGSWYEALVAVDPLGAEEADPELLADITAYLEPYRRMGHDLEVKPAKYVPLDLALTVCVLPLYLRGHVEAALLDIFSTRILPDGRLGFFHPDNLTFGEGIYVSRIVGAAQAVPGVQDVQVTRLERYEIGEPPPGTELAPNELPPHGVLSLAPFEIAQLDNDPSFPENGHLTLDMRGGR